MMRMLNNFGLSVISLVVFLYFLYWNKFFFGFQFLIEIFSMYWFKLKYMLIIDGISFFFVMLSSFLLSMCLLICWQWTYSLSMYLFNMSLSMFCLLNVFLTSDFFILFFFFELMVMPLFLLVGIWGSSDSKIYASYLLFIFTLLGSVFALFAFIFIFSNKGISNFLFLLNSIFLDQYQIFLFLFLFFGFSVKVPIVPLHMWLPEAHVEAPTAGSVMLAGIVLKLGFYVYMRLLVFTFNGMLSYVISFIFIISLLGLYLPSFSALAQIDMKKMIAYSSISHMNFSLMGLFSGNFLAIFGAFVMMFGHAIVSSALFASMGIIYDSYKTSLLFYYGGLVLLMPIWAVFFFVFILGNFGLPGTVNFVGEFMIFLGSFLMNNLMIMFCLFGLFLTLVYSLFLYVKLVNGVIKVEFISFFGDLTSREFFFLFPLLFLTIYFGLFPNVLFDYSFSSLYYWFFFN